MKKELIEQRLDEIQKTLHDIDKTLVVNTEHLAEHMRRTKILEEQIVPISQHVQQMRGAGKLLAILALIASIMAVIPLL